MAPHSIKRPRLTLMLAEASAPAVFVIAPAGFGKTALLAEYASSISTELVWLSAAEPCSDAGILGGELLRRIEGLPGSGQPSLELGAALARRSRPLTIIVDNCHRLVGQDFDGFRLVCSLIEDPQYTHIRWLLAGRPRRGLAIARLRLAGLAASLDGGDLAFTAEEVRAYLTAVQGVEVGLAEAEIRRRQTGGWAAGLALTAHLAGEPALAEYVEQEIAPSLTPELRAFAARCALLGQLDATLCDEVLQMDGSAELLQQLDSLNLLSQGRLLAPLCSVLAAGVAPAEARELRLRAAGACRTRQDWAGASRHLARANAWPELQSLLAEHGRDVLEAGVASELVRLLGRMKQAGSFGRALQLLECEALSRIGHVAQVKALLPGIAPATPDEQVRVDLLRTWLCLAGGDPAGAAQIARDALKRPSPAEVDTAHLQHWLAIICRALGNHQQAMRHHQAAIDLYDRLGHQARVAYEQIQVGITYRESGDGLRAEPLLRTALGRLRELGRRDYLPGALAALAALLLEMERPEETAELLSEARQVMDSVGDTFFGADMLHTAGTLYRAMGRNADALDALRRSSELASALGYVGLEQRSNLDWAVTMADLGKLEDAERVVQAIERQKPAPRVVVLATAARARIAWLRNDDAAVLRLCKRLADLIPAYEKHEYAPLPALLRLAVLVRSQAGSEQVEAAASEFLRVPYPTLSVLMFRDAAAVAWRGVRAHPDPAVRNNPIWKAANRWAFARDRDPRKRCPERISVSTLQHALRVEVDGVLFKHGWLRALDLFLYLVHVPGGGTANEIATALWGAEQRREITIHKRFHSMVAALRQLLGEETIVRDSSAPPGRYLLNPDIELEYDVAELLRQAEQALGGGEPRVERIQAACALRGDSYWPARNLRSPWFLKVSQTIEATYVRLREREAELSEETASRVS